ncbi:hypothetical protein QUF80_07585 [Desulfococcaceae bacterium HSG8]|nr:hypothetical protein [Desulfococcaceae bacterium HSG8]
MKSFFKLPYLYHFFFEFCIVGWLPPTVESGKGIRGDFPDSSYRYRIDTNKVAPGEGGFHLHIFQSDMEIAKVNGRGGFVKTHKGNILRKPSQLPRPVLRNINKLIRYVQKNFRRE